MRVPRYQLSPTWHVLAALVMASAMIFVAGDLLIPRSVMFQQAGYPVLAAWSMGSCFLVGAVGLVVLLPCSRNESRFRWVRFLGRINLLVRWFIASMFAMSLYAVVLLLGYNRGSSSSPAKVEYLTWNVPMTVVETIPARLKLLKPGMTEREVLDTLGLGSYRRALTMMGSPNKHWHSYALRPKYFLSCAYDDTKEPLPDLDASIFLSYRLDGDGWKK